jgi:hypothetical protein
MHGLSEVRRFVNMSKLDQRVFNPKQGDFVSVPPRGFVEGAQYGKEATSPAFRETTAHLTQKEFYETLPAENDIELLRRFAMIETNEVQPRQSVVKLIEDRIKKLQSQKAVNATDGTDNRGQGKETVGAGAAGTPAAGS